MNSDDLLLRNNNPLFAWIWSWFRIFLSIDETVDRIEREIPESRETPKTKREEVKQRYRTIVQEYAPIKKEIRKQSKDVGGLGVAIKNLKNIALTPFYMTAGTWIARYQNNKTIKTLRNNPHTEKPVVHLGNGSWLNPGVQARLATQMRGEGMLPHHLKMYHGLEPEEQVEKVYRQLDQFQEATKVNFSKIESLYSGQSSGGDTGIHLAANPRTLQYGIKKVQAVAPTPTGLGANTIWQKVLWFLPGAKKSYANSYEGMKLAAQVAGKKPVIPVQIVVGEADKVVRPEDAAYKHAADFDWIRGPHSTHWGTIGVNPESNRQRIQLMKKPFSEYKPLRASLSNVVSLNDYKTKEYQAAEPTDNEEYQAVEPQAPLRPAPSDGPSLSNVVSLNDYKTKEYRAAEPTDHEKEYQAVEPQAPLRPAPSDGPSPTNVTSMSDYKTEKKYHAEKEQQYQSERKAA